MNSIPFRRFIQLFAFAAVAIFFGPSFAYGHTGVSPIHDMLHGLEHPLTGVDHICAMVAVGLWAVQRGRRTIWFAPITFVLVMTLGGILGMAGVSLPFVEQGIVLSVIILGVLVAAAVRPPLPVSLLIIGFFALIHGHAHGTEVPGTASGVAYVAGFLIATICLHLAGISFGLLTQRLRHSQLVRFVGAALAACGVYLGIS